MSARRVSSKIQAVHDNVRIHNHEAHADTHANCKRLFLFLVCDAHLICHYHGDKAGQCREQGMCNNASYLSLVVEDPIGSWDSTIDRCQHAQKDGLVVFKKFLVHFGIRFCSCVVVSSVELHGEERSHKQCGGYSLQAKQEQALLEAECESILLQVRNIEGQQEGSKERDDTNSVGAKPAGYLFLPDYIQRSISADNLYREECERLLAESISQIPVLTYWFAFFLAGLVHISDLELIVVALVVLIVMIQQTFFNLVEPLDIATVS